MPKLTNTYALAYACCETILKELSRFPTIDLIRERIGVNSPNTIKQAMNDWTAAFAKQYIEQQQSPMACPEVPKILTDAVYRLWQDTTQEAERLANMQAAPLNALIAELQQTIAQQQAALSDARQQLVQADQKLAIADAQADTLMQDNAALQQSLLAAQQRQQELTQALEAQCEQELSLKAQHTQRLQQEQDWMQRRIAEERDLAADKWQAKQEQLTERLAHLQTQFEQALQAQALTQAQNRQLLEEIAMLKTQRGGKRVVHRLKR